MKTAESHIKEEVGKLLIDLVITGFRQWAKNEVNYIRYALNYPAILPINEKTFVIGNFRIENAGSHCYKVSKDKTHIHTFFNKKAAIFFCVFTKIKYFRLADNILAKDIAVSKLYDDIQFFQSKATTTTDSFKRQLWQSRLSELSSKFGLAVRELDKILISARYNKIWSTIV